MADDPTEVRDWIHFGIYVLCTVIQTFAAVVASVVVFWWDRRRRNKDRKEAKRKEDEEKQKADAEKIIAILSEKYDGAVGKFRVLKEHIDVLKSREIVTGPLATDTFTEFDVLLYMCHGDSWHKFDVMTSPLLQSNCIGYGRKEVMQAVTEIMKFFKDFAFQLSTIYRGCPDSIKSEFSTEIKEVGKTIYPFVTKTRQKLIEKVLIYFGCIHLSREQNSNVPGGEHQPLLPNATEMMPLSDADRQANELITYRGHEAIKDAIRYVEYLRYENDEMKYNIKCLYSNITNLEAHVKIREVRIMREEHKIREKIGELLDGEVLQGDLLHVIRIVMLKIKEGYFAYFASPERTEKLDTFIGYVRRIDSGQVSLQARVLLCERNLDRVQLCINHLEGVHKPVLRSSDTPTSLDRIATDLEELIRRHIN